MFYRGCVWLYLLGVFLMCASGVIQAGQNDKSSIVLDWDVKTQSVDSQPGEIIPGQQYKVAVVVQFVSKLHSYSVKIACNPEIVKCEGATKSISPEQPAFLESKGGSLAAFLVFRSREAIEIAASQAGEDSSVAIEGSGVLGYLIFKGVADGDAGLKIIDAKLVTVNGICDHIIAE